MGFRTMFLNYKKNIFLSIGIGSIVTCFLLIFINKNLPSIEIYEDTSIAGGYNISLFSYLLLVIGLTIMMIIPFLNNWNRKNRILFSLLLLIVPIDIVTAVVLIARSELFLLAIGIIWVSVVFYMFVFIQIIGVLHNWVKVADSDKYDIGKLTLVWVILAFILGRLV